MKELLEKLLERLRQGRAAVMVTVVGSRGSAPRGPGARMLVTEEGYWTGTVGGGAIEHQAVLLAQAMLTELREGCLLRTYSLTNKEAGSLGMVCGGEMRLLFQCLEPKDAEVIQELLHALEGERPVYWVTELAAGRMRATDERPQGSPSEMDALFVQRMDAGGWAYVFGGGHVAQALVPLLLKAGFRCRVLEDRAEFARPELFPGAQVRLMDFGQLSELQLGPEDDALIMTRGHAHDLEAVSAMLQTKARYIGMMGSRHKRAHTFSALRQQGFEEEDIARVHSPIGLSIGAETPFEIAVSIAAELIACRAAQAQGEGMEKN